MWIFTVDLTSLIITFIRNLETTLEILFQSNSFLILVIGYFIAKSKTWIYNHATAFKGPETENITSQFVLQQMIQETKHKFDTSLSLYIDQISTKLEKPHAGPNLAIQSQKNKTFI